MDYGIDNLAFPNLSYPFIQQGYGQSGAPHPLGFVDSAPTIGQSPARNYPLSDDLAISRPS